MRNLFMTLMLLLWTAPAVAADSPEISKNVLKIEGPIDSEVLRHIDKLAKASAESPIEELQILINSPGGYVTPGMVFVNTMELLKARGTKITCFVPTLAASMAFQILAHCDNRYVLAGALLLWHPVKAGVFGALTPIQATQLASDLVRLEKTLVSDLAARMPCISPAVFEFHYQAETLHFAEGVDELTCGKFITIVTNMPGLTRMMPTKGGMSDQEEALFREEGRDWIFDYRMSRIDMP